MREARGDAKVALIPMINAFAKVAHLESFP
jgi:hypothetical protein